LFVLFGFLFWLCLEPGFIFYNSPPLLILNVCFISILIRIKHNNYFTEITFVFSYFIYHLEYYRPLSSWQDTWTLCWTLY